MNTQTKISTEQTLQASLASSSNLPESEGLSRPAMLDAMRLAKKRHLPTGHVIRMLRRQMDIE